MPRPATKPDLIAAANEQYEAMWRLIDSMSDEERDAEFRFGDGQKEAHWARDRNVRDVLIHLYEWHQLLLTWIAANRRGEKAGFLPAPYTWKTYGEMNVGFWEKHQSTPYADAVAMLAASHQDVLAAIESFTNEELFTAKHFPWTGTTTLGSYCVSVTSSHYDWAIKKLRAHRKAYK